MKFILSKIFLTAIVITLSLTGCLSGGILPDDDSDVVGYKTISLHITQSPSAVRSLSEEAETRGVSRPIPAGELLEFNRGDLYLVSAEGVVIEHFRLVRNEATNWDANIINIDTELGNFQPGTATHTLVIPNVHGHVRRVVIIGNTPHNTQGGSIDNIGKQVVDLRSQHDAWNVNLFGETGMLVQQGTSDTWSGSLRLAPTVARLEIASITGVGNIADFTVAGIFVDNFFSRAEINGTIDDTSLWSGGTNPTIFLPGQGFFTANSNNALFDWDPNGLGTQDGLVVTPPQAPDFPNINLVDGRWAYQVFAPQNYNDLNANQQPRIIIRLRNVRLRDNTTYAERFVTINEFRAFDGIQAGMVYKLAVMFDERDLAAVPSEVPYLTATHPGLVFTHAPLQPTHIIPVTVSTNMREGWEITDYPNWIVEFSQTAGSRGVSTFYVTTSNNTLPAHRSGTITIQSPCGREVAHIMVTQLGSGVATAASNRFVGAFWRNEQVGERLIRMNMNITGLTVSGAWTATATVPWIQLCNSNPAFPPYETGLQDHTRRDTPLLPTVAADEGLRIEGIGNQINFRIGLRGQNTNPIEAHGRQPRYGQVIITYHNNTRVQIIWIRQGEDPDFLMRPEDDFGGQPRGIAARRFSPFNLTPVDATTGIPNVMPFTGTTGRNVQINAARSNSGFTTYPTQAGAYFEWAPAATGARVRRAYSPIGNASNVGATATTMLHGFWGGTGTGNNLSATHESCPPGWRRPNDGSISAVVGQNAQNSAAVIRNSEMRMSLFLEPRQGNDTPTAANTLFGRYADGFFDRRQVGQRQGNVTSGTVPVSVSATSTVSNDNRYVAHRGMLFFNPHSGASLFFPAAGRRSNAGALIFVGNEILYWSSTTSVNNVSSTSRAWILRGGLQSAADTNNAWMHFEPNRADAIPIRCVRVDN